MTNGYSKTPDYDSWHRTAYQCFDLPRMLRRNRKLHDVVVWQLGLSKEDRGKKLLDVACGKGILLRDIQDRGLGLDLYGIDISKFAISKAREYVEANLVAGDAQEMPYEDNFFDYISCLGGLEYYPDPEKGAREACRVLKDGGLFCVYVPNLMFIGHIYMAWRYGAMPSEGAKSGEMKFYDYGSEKLYTYAGWKDVFKNAGLEIINCKKYNLIMRSDKVSKLTRFLYNKVLQYFVPLNLSYSFMFLCKKSKRCYPTSGHVQRE